MRLPEPFEHRSHDLPHSIGRSRRDGGRSKLRANGVPVQSAEGRVVIGVVDGLPDFIERLDRERTPVLSLGADERRQRAERGCRNDDLPKANASQVNGRTTPGYHRWTSALTSAGSSKAVSGTTSYSNDVSVTVCSNPS